MATQELGIEDPPLVVDVSLVQILLGNILIHWVLSLNGTTDPLCTLNVVGHGNAVCMPRGFPKCILGRSRDRTSILGIRRNSGCNADYRDQSRNGGFIKVGIEDSVILRVCVSCSV